MSELFFHIYRGLALLEQKAREGVAEEVRISLRETRFAEQPGEDLADLAIVHRLSGLVLKQPEVREIVDRHAHAQELFLSVEHELAQDLGKLLAHIDLSGEPVLRKPDFALCGGTLHVDQAFHEIDVADL
ncbi:MAG TPA: hypothetical protein VGK65_17510 [Candidatus Binatia bacterium]